MSGLLIDAGVNISSAFVSPLSTSSERLSSSPVMTSSSSVPSASPLLASHKMSPYHPPTDHHWIWDYMSDENVFEGTPYVDMIRNNMQVVATICLSYVMLLFWAKAAMKDRKAFQIRSVTIGWNMFLSIFSFICFFKFTRETWNVWNGQNGSVGGMRGVVCTPPPRGGSHALWQLLFIASKVWEFGDTILLVLRKRPVIFLHWYHHMSVLMLSCFIGGRNSPLRRVFANVNSGVHAIMYTYYAAASAGYRAPKPVSMSITIIQLLQMVIGVYACIDSLSACNFSENSSAYFSLIIYASYFVLFANFFYQAYFNRSRGKPSGQPSGQSTQRDTREVKEVKGE